MTDTASTPAPTLQDPKLPEDREIPEVTQSLIENAYDVEMPLTPLSAMQPAKYNPREISEAGMSMLAESLKNFKLLQPIVWNKRTGNIVGGHQRYAVLLSQGVKEARTAVVDLDEKDEMLLNITLNNPNVGGEFNIKELSNAMKLLKSKMTAVQYEKAGLKAMEKQMPLFDGVAETPAADSKKRMTAQEAADDKLEKADIKMLQLFFSTENHRQLLLWLGAASEAIGTDNASDTVFQLLKAFNENLSKVQAAEAPATEATA